ncbi:GrpB family protein [Acetanaerobacterium elongatum]|uniref:GrpB domain, predicted nucleotidyltransferase, UPF0157 family n=1 Tax=Acetanaerobacterium elongatum TaxID=258515 RepID=A0A1G9ZHT4_9FIRM|nr:GrpB family protein [Acetanaerobacterium elongatum]SDN20930.1 GrpB domain, predicted nucleotidyltransferase, UPF0157 family [Acetanaerobacterium elongatum]
MSKQLKDMTNEELWQLFPIILTEHNPVWAKDYQDESRLLIQAIGTKNITRISHIGSTSIKGIMAKPTVDILLEISNGTDEHGLISVMEHNGYIYCPQPDNPAPHMMFMKGYTPNGFAEKVYHVHVRYPDDWDELYFRDYLNDNPSEAAEYEKLKKELQQQFTHNRDGYTNAKTEFVNHVTTLARKVLGEKYKIR